MRKELKELKDRALAFLMTRQRGYITTFRNPVGEVVLADLARFCRAHESTYNVNERLEGIMQGRRDVWLRIAQHLNLSSDELWKLYGSPEI